MTTLPRISMAALLIGGIAALLALRTWERSHGDAPYAFVEDGLYLGRWVREPPPGTEAVVNLCGMKDAYSVAHVLWDPILEGKGAPTVEWLRSVVDFLEKQKKAGRTIYVHCLAGVNRSAMVVAAYLMREHGWSRDQAVAFVRSKRPQANPDSTLMQLLAEWERTKSISGN